MYSTIKIYIKNFHLVNIIISSVLYNDRYLKSKNELIPKKYYFYKNKNKYTIETS